MTNKELRLHLRYLGEGKHLPSLKLGGICNELRYRLATDKQYSLIKRLMAQWPNWSGRKTFPIPHPTVSPAKAFTHVDNLWEPDKQVNEDDRIYVENRLILCRWLARQLYKLPRWK